jgi:Bacteriophage abortive infection AbiH
MNILYIIGNGFDLNLGLNTSYKDFYNYYLKQENDNDLVKNLKNQISGNYDNWSDMELGLGHYTENINNVNDFDIIYMDLVKNLAAYLQQEQRKFTDNIIEEKILKIGEDFKNPFQYLSSADRERIEYKLNNEIVDNGVVNIDFMVFNYTETVSKIIYLLNVINDKNEFGEILHIHGELDKHIILGVNDLSQLKNEELHNIVDIKEQIVKKDYNKGLAHNLDIKCQKKINNADIVCLFGSSVGDTDKIWWDQIGKQLELDGINLVIFTKDEEHPELVSIRNNRIKRKIQSRFIESETILDSFHVGINTEIFKT